MKYKLINSVSKKETICDKVVVDGWDYYVSDKCNDLGGWHIDIEFSILSNPSRFNVVESMREIIATNNPSIDIPKVVDEVEMLAKLNCPSDITFENMFIRGYNKSQETHPFSEEDVIEFNEWLKELLLSENSDWLIEKTTKELLQLWKEQKPKKIYYNE